MDEELQYEEQPYEEPPEGVIPTEFSSQRRAPAEEVEPTKLSLDEFVKLPAPPAGKRAAEPEPDKLSPDEFFESPLTASRPGAFARGLAEGVVPAAAGMGGGILSGAGTGLLAGAAGAGPIGAAVGTIGGGVLGGILAGYAGAKAQDWVLEALGLRDDPTSAFSRQQQQTDEALFPYSRAAGGITAALPTLRPGGKLIERGIGAAIGGVSEAAMDAYQTGHVDPVKIAMGAGAGAAFPNINKPTSNLLTRAVPRSWEPHMPNFDPASRTSEVPENYLPRAPREEGPRQPYGPQQPEEPPAWQGPRQPSGPQLPEVEDLQRSLAANRAQRNAPDTPPGLQRLYDSNAATLQRRIEEISSGHAQSNTDRFKALQDSLERNDAQRNDPHTPVELHGYYDRNAAVIQERLDALNAGHIDPVQGLEPVSPKTVDLHNDVTTVAAGQAAENAPVLKRPEVTGNQIGSPGNKLVADGAVDESKAARPAAAGGPSKVSQGNVDPTIAAAARAAQPEAPPAAPPAAGAPPVAPAGSPPAAARPAAPVTGAVTRPRQRAAPAQAVPDVAAEIARLKAENAALARGEAPPAAAAPSATVTPIEKPTLKLRPKAQQAIAAGRAVEAKKAAAAGPVVAPKAREFVAPITDAERAAKLAKPAPAPEPAAAPAVLPKEAAQVPAPATKQATKPTLTLPKTSLLKKIGATAKKALGEEKGSIDIGPAGQKYSPAYTEAEARQIVTDYKSKLFDADGPNIAHVLMALNRDSRRALRTLNDIIGRHPEIENKPGVVEARNMLSEQAGYEPGPRAEPSPPVLAGKRVPLERTFETAAAERGVPVERVVMVQKDPKGRWIREAPYNVEKMHKWHDQLPDYPIGPRVGRKRESTPKYETPEPKVAPVREKLPGEDYTPPGKRAPRTVTDPVTGELRETKVFRDEPKPAKLHGLDEYTPDEKMRFIDAMDKLPEAQQTEALARTLTTPKNRVLANLERLPDFLEQERATRTEARLKLSTGAGAKNLPDKAHRQGIIDAYDKAYAANPRPTTEERAKAGLPPDETLSETVERATKMVKQANADINSLVADLTAKYPKQAHLFTGKYSGGHDKSLGSTMIAEARELVRHPTKAQKQKFDTEDLLNSAELSKETRGVEAGPEKLPGMETRTTSRPTYEPRADETSPTFTSGHKDLVNMLNGLSDRAHDMMEGAWGKPIIDEVRNTKNPDTLKADLIGHLIDAQDADNKHAHALPEYPASLVGIKPVSTRAGIQKVEQTGRFKPTKPADFTTLTKTAKENPLGAKVYEKGTKLYQEISNAALKFFGNKEGSLDVTKVFDWIDKIQQKYRPDREPMVPTGMTRLYKVEPEGKWAAPTREEIANDKGTPPTKFADVPTNVIEQYRTDGVPGTAKGKAAERFARKWDKEMHLPPGAVDQRVHFEPEDAGIVDHLRRLWADESGALDVGKVPKWVPSSRNMWRDWFSPKAPASAEAAMQQLAHGGATKLGDDIQLEWAPVLRNKIAIDKRDLLFMNRKAPVIPEAEANQIGRAFEDRATLPSRQQKYWDEHGVPMLKRYRDLYNEVRDLSKKLKAPGHEDLPEPVDNGSGYAQHLPRMVKAELKVADDYDPRFTRFDPLNPRKPATMDRGWFALQQDKTKAREIYHYNEAGDLVTYKDGIAGKIYRKADLPDGFDPRQVGSRMDDKLVDNAKIDEIMAHGNTDEGKKPVYERNPLYAMSNAVNDLIYSKARLEFFDKLINDKDYQKNVTTDRDTAEKRWGANNIMQVTGIQQLEKNWYPKQVGRALEDLVRMGVNYSNNQAMEAISRFSQSALKPFYFIGPEVHVMNVLDKLVIGRGFDNLNVPKTIRNFTKGLEAIRRQGEDVDDFARAGGNPMFLHALTSRLMPNIAKELGVKIQEQHWKLDPLFKKAGINTKADYWEPTYQASNKMMWWQNDVLAMMLHYDNLDRHGGGHENWTKKFADLKKLNETKNPTAEQVKQRDELGKWKEDLLRTSVREVDKIVDSYIVPTTFGRSFGVGATSDWGRGVQKVLTEPAFANFGRFSWGLMNTLVNIGKNMAGRNENLSAGHSAALGFSQAAMMMGMLSVVYPLLSKAYQQMPWAKPDSKFEERGISNVVNIIPETIHKGIKDTWPKVARRALSPAIGVNLALTSYENRDNIGRPIMDSSGPGGWGAVPFQALGHIFDQIVSPAGQVSRAYAQEGAQFAAQRFIESNFGVKTPSEAQVKYEQKRPQTEIREGRSREKHPRGVFDLMGNKARQLVRGYEEGGPVTATETAGVIPTSRR